MSPQETMDLTRFSRRLVQECRCELDKMREEQLSTKSVIQRCRVEIESIRRNIVAGNSESIRPVRFDKDAFSRLD